MRFKHPQTTLPQRRVATHARSAWFAAALLAATLTGCADMAGITSKAQLTEANSLGLSAPAASQTKPQEAAWWQAFGDDTLNQLVAQALQNNPSLKLAQARLAAAQSVSQLVGSNSKPQLQGQLSLTQQQYTANGAIPPPLAGSVRDSGTAQLSASWEIDFFGKHQAALQAALGSEQAAQADARAASVLLASQVANSYLAWVGLTEQRNIVSRTLAQRQETLQLVQDRVRAGLDTPLELRQSQGSLPEARLQLEVLDEQLALTRNALMALIGEPNKPLALLPKALAAIKTIPVTESLTTNLLGQRADVVAARWRVEAADKTVDSARAQFYPNINLTAFAGFSSIGLDQLMQSGSQQWGFGPALSLPLFDSGRLRANLSGKAAERDAAVESYNSTLISAVHDVLDQLSSRQAITRQQDEQAQAGLAAQDAWSIAQQRYRAGLANYLQVLSAENAVLTQRRQAADLATRALQNQVALARALGGVL